MINDDDKLAMMANLSVEPCGLRHDNPRKAINYVCQEFDGGEILTIPICVTCEIKMGDNDWILLYCMNCHSNHWIFKPDSMRQYHYGEGEVIKWMPACPYCSEVG